MNLFHVADSIFNFSSVSLALILFFFGSPFFAFFFHSIGCFGRFATFINFVTGKWENITSPFRLAIGLFYLVAGITWQTYVSITNFNWFSVGIAMFFAFLFAATILNQFRKRSETLRLIEYSSNFPTMHHRDFFKFLLCSRGIFKQLFPETPYRTLDPANIDFTKGTAKKLGVLKLLNGVNTTITITRLICLARKKLGSEKLQKIAPSLAAIWAFSMSELAQAKVTVEGIDSYEQNKCGKIFLYTHKSFFDFVLAFLVPLSLAVKQDSISELRVPSFLVAANHFKRNFLFRSVFGIGKAAEALGMIFVERGEKGSRDNAENATSVAADKMVDEGLPIALFPQGTRTCPYKTADGKRIDAGYYTAGSKERIGSDFRHLKKGAAFITAKALLKRSSSKRACIELIPVAISGTANICPRGSMKVMSGISVRLVVGEPLIVGTNSIAGILTSPMSSREDMIATFAAGLNSMIDSSLKGTAKIHAELERRFFKDIHGMLDSLKFDEVAIAMKTWRGEDSLVHSILDIIYSCEPKMWRTFLGELIHMILNFSERDEFLTFKKKVAQALPISGT